MSAVKTKRYKPKGKKPKQSQSSTSVPSEALDELEICPNCQDKFQQPRLLPCLHTICLKCCEDVLKEEEKACPICNEVVEVEAVTELLPNPGVKSNDISNVKCDECDEEQMNFASHQCKECNNNLCPRHVGYHATTRSTKNHQLNQIDNTVTISLCSLHKDQVQDMYCDSCSLFICPRCAVSPAHSEHDVLNPQQVIDNQIERFTSAAEELTLLMEPVKQAASRVSARVKAIRQRETDVVNKISTSFEMEIIDCRSRIYQLEIRRKALITQTKDILTAQIKKGETQQHELENILQRADSTVKQSLLMASVLKTSPHLQQAVLQTKDLITQKIDSLRQLTPALKPAPQNSLRFVFNRNRILNSPPVHQLGMLRVKGQPVKSTFDWTKIGQPVEIWGDASVFNWPVGLAITSDDRLIVVDKTAKQLSSITTFGKIMTTKIPGFSNPHNIAIDSDDRLYITDRKSFAIHCLPSNLEHIDQISAHRPVGVAVHQSSGKLYYSDEKNAQIHGISIQRDQTLGDVESGQTFGDEPPFQLVEDEVAGPFAVETINEVAVETIDEVAVETIEAEVDVETIEAEGDGQTFGTEVAGNEADDQTVMSFGSEGDGPGQFKTPRGICILSSLEYLAVCDYGNDRVQILSLTGEFVRSIQPVQGPQCVCNYKANDMEYIIVTETKANQVSVWTVDGQRVHAWGTKGSNPGQFDHPYGIATWPDGRIAIADAGNHRIQVF